MCSLWPGLVQAEILMSVLQPALHEVSAYSRKLMERASCGSPGSHVLSPGIKMHRFFILLFIYLF